MAIIRRLRILVIPDTGAGRHIKKPRISEAFLYGAQGRNRTTDTRIFNPYEIVFLRVDCHSENQYVYLQINGLQYSPCFIVLIDIPLYTAILVTEWLQFCRGVIWQR